MAERRTLSVFFRNEITAFLSVSGLTHKELAALVGCQRSQLAAFLGGNAGLSQAKTLKLLQVLNSSRAELERKFGRKVTSHILELEESGRTVADRVQFDIGSWVAKESASDDPVNSTSITDTYPAKGGPIDGGLIDTLRAVQNLHRSAIAEIDKFIASAQRARPNAQGWKEPPRKIADDTASRTPGSRGDLFSYDMLRYLKSDREAIEKELKRRRDIEEARKARDNAKSELMRLEKR